MAAEGVNREGVNRAGVSRERVNPERVNPQRLIAERLRSHRLAAPAAGPGEAATHMLAVQAQDFTAGRWALAARSRAEPTLRRVDAAFDAGTLVRSWTMRGTIHIVPARDLGWMLSVTADRQRRQAAAVHAREGLDDDVLHRAERLVRAALRGGGRLTRSEFLAVLDAGGVPVAGQRGYHLIVALALRGVVCWGPVVPRAGAPTREQHLVLVDEWVTDAAHPADPLAELFVRYIAGHGPAGAEDFAWWTGLPLGDARRAAAASVPRLTEVDAGQYVAPARPRRASGAPRVLALGPFDEYYISYADRGPVADAGVRDAVGPGRNGMVRAIILADGRVVGTWTHSLAAGRHTDRPVPALLVAGTASADEVAAALDRYARFITS
ncbi:winged helix DNA-binding domain-containing protein [Microbacterium luticocti]|uniref:winged helix DNA-binding domain-containing protein n=1 Tax=Microbacterium luticocti TaxID=451764 RepID=UPI00041A72DC|nr:winged helix DNA-binding domain-containing protein [Microbacterium luticocti]